MNRAEESEQLSTRLQKANDAKDAFLKVTTQDLQRPLHDAVHLWGPSTGSPIARSKASNCTWLNS